MPDKTVAPPSDPIEKAVADSLRWPNAPRLTAELRDRLFAAGYEIRPRTEVVGYVELLKHEAGDVEVYTDDKERFPPVLQTDDEVSLYKRRINQVASIQSHRGRPLTTTMAIGEVRLASGEAWR